MGLILTDPTPQHRTTPPRGAHGQVPSLRSQSIEIPTVMELGPQNHNGDGLLGPNSIIVVYMDPLGYQHKFVD